MSIAAEVTKQYDQLNYKIEVLQKRIKGTRQQLSMPIANQKKSENVQYAEDELIEEYIKRRNIEDEHPEVKGTFQDKVKCK